MESTLLSLYLCYLGLFVAYYYYEKSSNDMSQNTEAVRSDIKALAVSKNISYQRMNALEGEWVGTFDQPIGPAGKSIEQRHINASLNFDHDDQVNANFSFIHDDKTIELETWSSSMNGDYITMHYVDTNGASHRHGTITLKHSSNGDRLDGKFVARAPEMEGHPDGEIVAGDIQLIKKTEK